MCMLIGVCIEFRSLCGSLICYNFSLHFFTSRSLFLTHRIAVYIYCCCWFFYISSIARIIKLRHFYFVYVFPFLLLLSVLTAILHMFFFVLCIFFRCSSLVCIVDVVIVECRLFSEMFVWTTEAGSDEPFTRANRVNATERPNKTTNSILLQHWIGDGTQQVADNSWRVLCCILYVCDCDYDCSSLYCSSYRAILILLNLCSCCCFFFVLVNYSCSITFN